jgi:L-alanine-DL-glutamate epimerase-like enolase superfamily enzyme
MAKILHAEVAFQTQRLAMPLQLSSGMIDSLTEATASVVVEVAGQRATGRGAIYLSDLWAWPDPTLLHDERDAVLRRLCETIAAELPRRLGREELHPLELGLRLHDLACNDLPLAPSPSILARAMCGSPFDAAIHDAAGFALDCSALALYDDHASPIPSADEYFASSGACRAIAAALQPPRRLLPAWYVVGQDDGLDRTMAPAIQKNGYCCFKLKITGRDNGADVDRTVEVFRKALECGAGRPRITIDSNEANPSADSVLDYLERLEAADASTYSALEYLEQPTARDIRRNAYDWRQVTKRKPVLLDEGLTELGMLEEARRQGYSGFALKTCKGHSMLLVSAAWALQNDMLISIQDLTNPGIALIHAAILGSQLPTINGAELNSPQFTPAANQEFLPRLRDLFEPREGVHQLPRNLPHGLGSDL